MGCDRARRTPRCASPAEPRALCDALNEPSPAQLHLLPSAPLFPHSIPPNLTSAFPLGLPTSGRSRRGRAAQHPPRAQVLEELNACWGQGWGRTHAQLSRIRHPHQERKPTAPSQKGPQEMNVDKAKTENRTRGSSRLSLALKCCGGFWTLPKSKQNERIPCSPVPPPNSFLNT